MVNDKPSKQTQGHRMWRKGERAKVSVMQVFRTAYAEHDARKANQGGSDAKISKRSQQRREGVNEAALRDYLQDDLNALMNTINMGSTVDLEDVPHVKASILNYGFRDLSAVTLHELGSRAIRDSIRQSLINHEPRLVTDSIDVRVTQVEGGTRQRLSISVSAELMGDPVDIPLDFDAEVDVGAGKLKMSKLKVQM